MPKKPLALDHDCRLSKGGAKGIDILRKNLLMHIIY